MVDDSPVITQRVCSMVRELDCVSNVFVSYDYTGAVLLLENVDPDIVLLDIHLPQKSGIELLAFIRKNYPSVKVIMVTNQVSGYYKNKCKELGSDYFIDKSKEFETIPDIIASYC